MKKLLIFPLFIICYLLLAAPSGAAEQLEPGGTPENCYVCRDRKWYLASDDGTCPKDKEIKECKKDDESTFGGCTGGVVVVGETCESTQEDKLGVSEGKSLFSPDNAAKLIPYGETGANVSDEELSAKYFSDISKPRGDASIDPKCNAKGITNPLEFLVNLFKTIGRLLGFGIGVTQTIYTADSNAPTACAGEQTPAEFNRGTRDLIDSLNPAGINPFRNISGIPSAINIQSQELKDLIKSASEATDVPMPLLMAFSRTEAGGTFGYTPKDVGLFSTDQWWTTASPDVIRKGYCYNTCEDSSLGCLGQDVRGAMQFEERTWNSYIPQVKDFLKQDDSYTPNRCNLRDVFFGAAAKIKQDAGPSLSWNEVTVRRVAGAYCGGNCAPSAACGPDYCSNVWNLYQSYLSTQP